MFCAISLKLNIPTFYTTGNKRQQNLFLPSYVLFIIFALWRQPHSVSRKLCVKEWPLPPPLHPFSHLYFCAFLHRQVCLNADGIKILLLPQSISVFLFVATDQSHLTHALIAKYLIPNGRSPSRLLHGCYWLHLLCFSIHEFANRLTMCAVIICLCGDVFVFKCWLLYLSDVVVSCIFALCSVKHILTNGNSTKRLIKMYTKNRDYTGTLKMGKP